MSTAIINQSIWLAFQCILLGVDIWGVRWAMWFYREGHGRHFLLIGRVMCIWVVALLVMIGWSIFWIVRAVA